MDDRRKCAVLIEFRKMVKSGLRKIYKQKRSGFSSAEIEDLSSTILGNLNRLPIWDLTVFHCFLPIQHQKEVNTFPLINELFSRKKRVAVPKIQGLNLTGCEIQKDADFKKGKFNTLEPEICQIIENREIEVVFLPMLICDKSGNRVGYGGGFYDRWLNRFDEKPLKIGLNFFSPINEISDVNEFDVRLDYCVTPFEIVSFSS
jgi:5-formyltetrahydrofolate cyclo-ligase